MKEFQINKYITLKIENGRTNIYVKRELFRYCTILVLNIPATKISDFDKIQSIDELSDNQNDDLDGSSNDSISIPLDVIFWGHCSNLQAWYEYDYNTRLLHRNLSFPLLKRLTEVGDPLARRVFKEEIAKRFASNHLQTTEYLLNEGYLDYLNQEELEILIINSNSNLKSLEEIQEIIDSGYFNDLNRLELLYYSKGRNISIKKLNIKFIENFSAIFDQGFPITFVLNNRSILYNLFFPLIKKISKEDEDIKTLFLEEIDKRLKNPTLYNYEILNLFKEVFITGYKRQSVLDKFV